jgi:excisionase family DNA binding protein
MTPEHRWLTTDEVAENLGVSRSTVRRWLREEKLAGHRIGKRWLVPRPKDTELTVVETAHLLRSHPDTVRRWLVDGKLPGRRSGKQWRIPQAHVVELVEGSSATGYNMSDNSSHQRPAFHSP